MQEINNQNLKDLLEEILNKNIDKNEDFKNGMNVIVQGLNDYMNAPTPPRYLHGLSEDFKTFALENFLNHDQSKLPTFEKLIQLFQIQMNKLNRYSTWDVYPDDLDDEIASTLIGCFSGIEITSYYTDFDRQGITIDLSINIKKEDGSTARLGISSYGDIDDNGFSDEEDENDYKIRNKLNSHLIEEDHYETLFLYVCLKKLYKYINPENVEKFLEEERHS